MAYLTFNQWGCLGMHVLVEVSLMIPSTYSYYRTIARPHQRHWQQPYESKGHMPILCFIQHFWHQEWCIAEGWLCKSKLRLRLILFQYIASIHLVILFKHLLNDRKGSDSSVVSWLCWVFIFFWTEAAMHYHWKESNSPGQQYEKILRQHHTSFAQLQYHG